MDTNSISPPKLAQSEQPRCEQTEGHTDTLLAQRDALREALEAVLGGGLAGGTLGERHIRVSEKVHEQACAALALVQEAPDA